MKIFKMNDYDWVAAETLEEAKQALADTINCGDIGPSFEEEFLDSPKQLDDEELDRLQFVEDPDIEPKVKKSFRQKLNEMISEGEKFPTHFASSEY